jgi:hypothetical protein
MIKGIVSLVAVLLPACTVDTPVVEGDKDPLGDDLGAWCTSMCDRLDACDDVPREVCAGSCVENFTAIFSGRSSACQAAGRRIRACVDGATCETLEACSITEEEDSACAEVVAGTTCDEPFTSGQPTQGFECAVGWDVCSDGKEYSLECVGESDSPECTCVVGGHATGRFTPSGFVCPSAVEAIRICAWPFVNWNEPPQTECDLNGGELPVLNPAECAAQYTVCSDARDYEVRCGGSVGEVVCACIVDGQMVGSYQSSTGICPFIEDPDSGRVEANYGCGFRIAPVGSG